jgi:hypothetical protein
MGGQAASGHSAPTTVVAPAQATGVDDIADALDSYFKAHYPTSDFTSALKKLTLVRDAEDRGDRRTVEVGHEKWGQATLLRALRGRPRARRKWCQEQFFLSRAFDLTAQEIVDDLEAALEHFPLISNDLGSDTSGKVP